MKTSSVLLASLCGLLIACGQRIEADTSPASTAAEPLVKAAPAPLVEIAPVSAFKTTLYSEHDAEVTARIEGVIRSIGAELGDGVAAGAVLAQLEDEREAAAFHSAKAAL